jgi:hypothetical protein
MAEQADNGAIPAADTGATGALDSILKAPKATYYGPESRAVLDNLMQLHQRRAAQQMDPMDEAFARAGSWWAPTQGGSLGEVLGNVAKTSQNITQQQFKQQSDAANLALQIAQMKDAAQRQQQVQALMNKAYDRTTGKVDMNALRLLTQFDPQAAAQIVQLDKAMRDERVMKPGEILTSRNPITGEYGTSYSNQMPDYVHQTDPASGAAIMVDKNQKAPTLYFTGKGATGYQSQDEIMGKAPARGGPLPSNVPLPQGTPQGAPQAAPRPRVNPAAASGVDSKNRTVGGLTRDQFVAQAVASGQAPDEKFAGAMFDKVLPPVGSTIMRPGTTQEAPKSAFEGLENDPKPQGFGNQKAPPLPGVRVPTDTGEDDRLRAAHVAAAEKFVALPEVRQSVERASAYKTIQNLAKNPTGGDDRALIIQFNKLLDPTSVVREGEAASAADLGGYAQKVEQFLGSKLEGAKLTPEQRSQLVGAANKVISGHMNNMESFGRSYRNLLINNGLETKRVMFDPFGGIREDVKKSEQKPTKATPSPAGKILKIERIG